MKAGPERDLFDRYASRARAISRSLGIRGPEVVEVDEGRGRSVDERRREEALALAARLALGTAILAFDERGRSPTSVAFAQRIAGCLAAGTASLALVVGGPDGLDEAFRSGALEVVSFGAATMPHQLVRIVLAEQVYRAFTILTRHPYHRG